MPTFNTENTHKNKFTITIKQPIQLTFDFVFDNDDESDCLHSILSRELRDSKRSNKIIAIRWYGGKYSHLDWLLPLLPGCQHFCEPFGGSAAVLLNREPSNLETYNDIDGDLVNFFPYCVTKLKKLLRKLFLRHFPERNLSKLTRCEGGRTFQM